MRRWPRLLAATILACGPGLRQAPALEPSEVCVLYNTKSTDSLAVANFYLKARHIPPANLIPLICAVGENTTEDEYRRSVVPQVQKALANHPLVKCLVTTYDVPLRIAAWQPTFAQRQEINTYKTQLDAVLDDMDREIAAYQRVAGGPAPTPPPATQTSTSPATAPASREARRTWQDQVQKLNTAANAALRRMENLDEKQRPAALQEFARIQEQVAGLKGMLSIFQVREDAPGAENAHARIERLQTQLRAMDQQIQELMKDRNNPAARKKIVALTLTAQGLVGQARQIDEILTFLQPVETESCFDNELALVLENQDYPRARWMVNPNNVAFYPSVQHMAKVPKSLLVARVDGPTVVQTQLMITTGLTVEKKGLDGKIYLDARGIHEGGYAVFDGQLRETAAWLKTNSTMECVLDDKPELLEAKDCPNAALYCGWYSLRNFKESCQWVPGGVGYHVASAEMISLHNPGETGWVVNLLKRGYCGTLGPTAEPYLASFPNPAHFFPLLMSGEFTQGEVWQLTAPMLSWRTGFVGDPLYNPFKAHPRVNLEALKEHPLLRNAFTILRPEARPEAPAPPAPKDAKPAPPSPATHPSPDQ